MVAGLGNLGRTLKHPEPTLAEIIDATRDARAQRSERERQEYVSTLPRIGARKSEAKFGPDVNREGLARLKQMVASVGRPFPDESDAGRADVG